MATTPLDASSPARSAPRFSWEAAGLWASILLPLTYYIACIPLEFTYGDGPEILTAVLRRGVTHPSGYPLYSILGQLFANLPWATPHWNMAVALSAIPGALTCGLIYLTLRRVAVHPGIATATALMYGLSDSVLFQSTKVEVYALHCLLLAAVIYSVVRYIDDRENLRWAYLAVLAQCLALADHLTSVFMVLPLVITLIALGPRRFFQPRTLGIFTLIALGGAALYAYLPLAALSNTSTSPSWNDPETLELFWYHVRGAEYDSFHDFSKLGENLAAFASRPEQTFLPGILAVVVAGVVEGVLRRRYLTLLLILFMASSLVYVCTYVINDISTYYGGIYLAGLIFFGMGAHWLLSARIPSDWKHAQLAWGIAVGVMFLLPAQLAWRNRSEALHDVLAEDMSASIVASLPERALIFTSVDGHTFPLWYQAYVNHPEKPWIVIDRVLFRLPDKRWYRDFLRQRHPDAVFPTEEEMNTLRGGPWEQWVLDRNRERYAPFAMLASPWTVPGYYPVNQGWHFELRPNSVGDAARDRTRDAMHIYMGHGKRLNGNTYFFDSQDRYPSGQQRIACVGEWWKHSDLTGVWTFVAPDGTKIMIPPHFVPSDATVSWEFLERNKQVPGEWRCEIRVGGRLEMSRAFTLE